jgi:hypothetical protein
VQTVSDFAQYAPKVRQVAFDCVPRREFWQLFVLEAAERTIPLILGEGWYAPWVAAYNHDDEIYILLISTSAGWQQLQSNRMSESVRGNREQYGVTLFARDLVV